MKPCNAEKICAECAHYSFKGGNTDGPCSAYCNYHKSWFPGAWEDGRTLPGLRTCKNWKQMGVGLPKQENANP